MRIRYNPAILSLSSIPMVGCRNGGQRRRGYMQESIKHSDGGVSEHDRAVHRAHRRVYQAFRWWGVGTARERMAKIGESLSSIPMVGCRNCKRRVSTWRFESIKHSDGGVSERYKWRPSMGRRVYQAFRWWGVGTANDADADIDMSLSSIPMVGCRNMGISGVRQVVESIKHSDGGVSERTTVTNPNDN